MINWVNNHPVVDSQYILTLHRISYRTNESDIKTSFEYYEKVSTLSDSLNFNYGRSLAQINLGILLSTSTNFEGSNSAYFSAIEFAEKYGAKRLKAVSLNNIGENFLGLNDPAKCRQYTLDAIELNKELEAWRGVAINYELLQQCDLKERNYSGAYQNLLTGMTYAERAADSYVLSLYYIGFGKYKAHINQMDSAAFYFDEAIQKAGIQNDLRNIYQACIAQVEFLSNISDKEKIKILNDAYSIATQTGYEQGIAYAAELLSTIYERKNLKDSSLHYFKIYRAMNDSIFSENNQRNVVIKETDWMLKRKEIENKHLKELSLIQNRDLGFKNALLVAFFILLLLIIATSFFIYKNIRSKKKRDESALKHKIAETKMQSLRAQMNPHFIFNSLNSIENFIMKNEKRDASDYLNKFSALIRIILESSRVERAPFTKDFEAIQLYVELEQLRFNHKFKFTTKVDPELFNEDVQVPPLLIQPYVENAILHGISQSESDNLELQFLVSLEDDFIIYTVEDNGIGRVKAAEYKKNNKHTHQSFGLQVTQERIDILSLQLKTEAQVTITDLYNEQKEPAGTRVQLRLKVI